MWFKQFKIKNYRSIVDTGWHDLSSDNITALIGQNESGKTSILESLNSFFTCLITDDILRSDLSLPEVSCSFSLSKKASAGPVPIMPSIWKEFLAGKVRN